MTKLLMPKILLMLLMSFFATSAIAHDIEVKNADGVTIYYKWINNKTELGVSYRGDNCYSYTDRYSGNVVIPESVKYNGKTYSVTSIGNSAFQGCGLTSITIPNSVTSIGNCAFWVCSGLTSITIPNSVTSIGNSAFQGCGLTSITIPNSVTSIGTQAFEGCKGLTSITIPNSVTSISNSAFDYCSGLTSINVESGNTVYDSRENSNAIIETKTNSLIVGCKKTKIPNSVTSIGNQAFAGCEGLTSITIPNSVTSIGELAFSECSGLTSITIPNSVTSISNSAFYYCSGLTSINVESGNTVYDSRENSNAIIETKTNSLIVGCKNTIIPNSVTSIGDDAFQNCSGLTSITIPNSVTSIGHDAFWFCSGLTSITIPNSVTSIGNYAFYCCKGLTSITIPNSVTSIGYHAFDYCSGLTSINVESGNTVYDSRENSNAIIETKTNSLIVGCKNTIIPNSVTSIGYTAFYGCSGLTSITIPNSVTSIGYNAFYDCSSLTSIISKIQNPFVIEDNVFKNIYATATLTVPKGTKAAYQATEGWNKFVNIVEEGATDEVVFTSDGVTYLGSNSNKTAVVKSVDTKLKTLEIPASVTYNGTSYQVTGIADNAFSGCTMAALIWNADAALPSNAFSSASIGSNFLLFVKSESYAPSSVKNIIVNGTAPAIVLSDDGGLFYCPQSFTARSISYTHNYSMETGGSGMGWETIALPFNVQKVSHSPRGEIVPFASYGSGSNLKPFWLASMVSSGFRSSSSIQANTPYIIAMPNNSSYRNDYILAGDVTFSAENVSVPVTPTFSGFFVPAYSTIAKSASVYALNVRNRYVTNTGNYVAGSRFISNLRDVRPFEAYISQGSSTRGVIEIGFSDGTTGMADVIGVFDEDRAIDIYTLSGQKVAQTKQSEIDNILNQLPHGVYIVNGKKIVK